MKWTIAMSVALLAHTARADQCAWVDDAAAHKAKDILAKQPTLIEFCEPCGDQAPGAPRHADHVEIAAPQAGYKQLSINGEAVDLAYVFVKTSAKEYRNLAILAGCPTHDVSASLAIADETPHGVLISASDHVPAVESVVAPAPAADPPPAPPTPMQTIYIYPTKTEHVPWLELVFACAAGLLLGAASLNVASALKRRRAMRPRAADLPHS